VDAGVERLDVSVYTVPTERPEADGTLAWDSTTIVLVEATAGGATGIGYTYGPAACARVIEDTLRDQVVGTDPLDVPGAWEAMVRAVRNQGRPGVVSMAISAVDTALWDLKARLLGVSLCALLGRVRETVPVYGSGGFISMSDDDLQEQLAGWVHGLGIPRAKIKIGERWGRDPERDMARVQLARKAIGDAAQLFVDANGGYTRKQAVRLARRLGDWGVSWFEEPVSSDDLDGLREIRDLIDLDVAAGEYGYDLAYFHRMLAAGAVDCLQVDVTRCGGVTEFLRAAGVAAGFGVEVSAHCAPALSAHPMAAIANARHIEYFADHARIERMLLEGAPEPDGGSVRPDPAGAGTGLTVRRSDAERFRTA